MFLTSDNIIKKETFVEGDSVNISCHVEDSPSLNIWWTREETNSTFHQDGDVLRFDVVNRTDAGVYLCVAQNSTADDNSTSVVDGVDLDIECKVLLFKVGQNIICLFKLICQNKLRSVGRKIFLFHSFFSHTEYERLCEFELELLGVNTLLFVETLT